MSHSGGLPDSMEIHTLGQWQPEAPTVSERNRHKHGNKHNGVAKFIGTKWREKQKRKRETNAHWALPPFLQPWQIWHLIMTITIGSKNPQLSTRNTQGSRFGEDFPKLMLGDSALNRSHKNAKACSTALWEKRNSLNSSAEGTLSSSLLPPISLSSILQHHLTLGSMKPLAH